MINLNVNGERVFQVLAHSFSVSPSAEGYTLAYSADGINFTDYEEATPANETLIVNGVNKGEFFKLKGNASQVVINY